MHSSQEPVLVNIRVGPEVWELLVQVLLSLGSLETEMGLNNFLGDGSHAVFAQEEMTGWGSVDFLFQSIFRDDGVHQFIVFIASLLVTFGNEVFWDNSLVSPVGSIVESWVVSSRNFVSGGWGSLDGPWSNNTIKWSVLVLVGDGSLLINLELEVIADLNRIGEVSQENWALVSWNVSVTQWVNFFPGVLKSISQSLLVLREISSSNLIGNFLSSFLGEPEFSSWVSGGLIFFLDGVFASD